MSILVITTGGTIGAVAVPDPHRAPVFTDVQPDGRDLAHEALRRDFAAIPTHCLALEHRDSKLIDTAYRDRLLQIVENAHEDHVLITHGTDTLLATADYFYQKAQEHPWLRNKKIMLTGAMVPLANGPQSDGYMNLKFSLEQLAAHHVGTGIYIVLCDYIEPEKHQGWAPRLYSFVPGRYRKYYDPKDSSRSHLQEMD